jgi:hypothetical protein
MQEIEPMSADEQSDPRRNDNGDDQQVAARLS